MKKLSLIFTLLFVLTLTVSAALLITDSGVSSGTADKKVLDRKSSWDASQANDWIVVWAKIPSGSNLENGTTRYQYKLAITAPDSTKFSDGPFDFDSNGNAQVFKRVSYFANAKTTLSPQPAQGEWRVDLDIVDVPNNKEDLGSALVFYLTGSDQNQAAKTVDEGVQKATGDSLDMAMMAVFNKTKEMGAQQEQQRQAAIVSTTITTLAPTTTTLQKAPAKKKPPKKQGKI